MFGSPQFFSSDRREAFSAAGSQMKADAVSKIPERVANQFVKIARAFFGPGDGLAGYAIYQSKMLDFRFGVRPGQ
jgi:hypothetical protein